MAHAQFSALSVITGGGVPSVEVRQSLPSAVDVISPFVDQLMSLIATSRSRDGSEIEIEIALHEALNNAILHGNHADPHKRIEVFCRCSANGEVAITVRDQGRGFDPSVIPDPTTAENKLATHGRGLFLLRAFMDEVSFEEGGRLVHMRKGPNVDWASPLRRLQ